MLSNKDLIGLIDFEKLAIDEFLEALLESISSHLEHMLPLDDVKEYADNGNNDKDENQSSHEDEEDIEENNDESSSKNEDGDHNDENDEDEDHNDENDDDGDDDDDDENDEDEDHNDDDDDENDEDEDHNDGNDEDEDHMFVVSSIGLLSSMCEEASIEQFTCFSVRLLRQLCVLAERYFPGLRHSDQFSILELDERIGELRALRKFLDTKK